MCFGGGVLVGLHIHMAAVVGSFSLLDGGLFLACWRMRLVVVDDTPRI